MKGLPVSRDVSLLLMATRIGLAVDATQYFERSGVPLSVRVQAGAIRAAFPAVCRSSAPAPATAARLLGHDDGCVVEQKGSRHEVRWTQVAKKGNSTLRASNWLQLQPRLVCNSLEMTSRTHRSRFKRPNMYQFDG
ncbi:hypothetical protein CC86DRAFT_438978 [Ophiobolus disseminans]|uniref:Uncharacterized protein n=1 Tax=Ophiobolus disseminans TaxID=1469910 RepID=A0A6A7A4M5_9PLEO|nr:hypothetical protein CC86DRAFT_438978 [Ophiobolus disseminans]